MHYCKVPLKVQGAALISNVQICNVVQEISRKQVYKLVD